MRWYFGFFVVSGFCSILYELVWLRLAMAQFAVTTALVSIVLSAFMVGLGLGSWGAGSYLRRGSALPSWFGLRLYALTELVMGISAIVVPHELSWGRLLLEELEMRRALGLSLTMDCRAFGSASHLCHGVSPSERRSRWQCSPSSNACQGDQQGLFPPSDFSLIPPGTNFPGHVTVTLCYYQTLTIGPFESCNN